MNGELDDMETLAAEYVLGTLDHAQRKAAESRLASDRAFARLVEEWTQRLAPLSQIVEPVEPPHDNWPAIHAALPLERRSATEPSRTASPSIWARLAFWRWSTALAATAAAALAVYLAVIPPQVVPETRFIAVLEAGPGMPAWLVSVDIARQQMTVRPYGELAVADRSYELWLIPGDAAQPRSLGVLSTQTDRIVPVSADLSTVVPSAAAFAVSLEPAGGSPTGLPTGPVLYQGSILPVAPRGS